MTTFNKNIEITKDRYLHLELPPDTPIGEVNISITITPIPKKPTKRSIMDFWGIFKDHPAFSSDSVEIQRKMRDEW